MSSDRESLVDRLLLWRFERQARRRYAHMTPWRSCNQWQRGICLHCYWWTVTGKHRRAKAAMLARVRATAPTLPRQVYRQDDEGRYRWSHTLPPEDAS